MKQTLSTWDRALLATPFTAIARFNKILLGKNHGFQYSAGTRRGEYIVMTHVNAVALLALASALAAPAWGQNESTSQDTQSVGDIVVTAQFRESNLQDTPLAITAV